MSSYVDSEPNGSTGRGYTGSRNGGYEDDQICIVGMACRLPGEVKCPSSLWQLLLDKKSTQGGVPPDRYNINGYYSSDGQKAGVMNVNGGYFLNEDVRQFDNEFFGINNFEAYVSVYKASTPHPTPRQVTKRLQMDPQQRKLLEVVFECFENAGATLPKMSGSDTGVFVGNFSQDHLLMQVRDPDDLRRYHATGAGLTMLANRISHTFNLHGPSLTLDTACSSSIYCLHLACSALKSLQCDGAVVAAANLIMTPTPHIAAMKAGMLSPTSTCHTFDISADGYARGEGINAIYLKRLSSAIRDRDNVYAIVRGTGINSNGHTPGMVYPSADLQEAVIRKTYKEANLDFSGTDYIECHGTGTELGDQVELTALAACFSRDRGIPLKIGGSKPNLGHSEAASSLTSLIKVSMAFRHNLLAPTAGIKTLNPKLELSQKNLEVVTEAQWWPRSVQRASVCSFGYGGANSHAILESVRSYKGEISDFKEVHGADILHDSCLVLPVTAASVNSLKTRLSQVHDLLRSLDDDRLIESLSYTLTERLTHFRHRASWLLSRDTSQPGALRSLAQTESRKLDNNDSLPFLFVFNGQGAQYHAMGKGLLDNNAVFLRTVRELDQDIQHLPMPYKPDWTLEETLRGNCDHDQVHEVTRSQPVCTAVQIGLVRVLESWGIRASATVGHSSGEIGAAYTSGVISAQQAIISAYFRGYAVSCGPCRGGMIACELSVTQAESLLHELDFTEKVRVACVNSSNSVTLSGDRECVDTIHSELQARQRFSRVLRTGGQAYHSSHMEACGAEYEDLLAPYFYHQPTDKVSSGVDMYSTVERDGDVPRVIDASTSFEKYWRKNLENPVLFEQTLSHVIQKQRFHILEIGAHAALAAPINQIRVAAGLDSRAVPYLPSLIRNQDANLSVKKLAAELFANGYELNWEAINSITPQNRAVFQELPPYPWDYSNGLRWFEPRSSIELRTRSHIRHELLGSQQLTGNGVDWTWRNVLRVDELPWIRDHNIDNQIIFPAAGYLAVIVESVSRAWVSREPSRALGNGTFVFCDVAIDSALVLPEKDDTENPVELHTTLSLRRLSSKKQSSNIYDFTISSWSVGESIVHCVGNVKVLDTPLGSTITIPDDELSHESSVEKWYKRYREEGIFFGPHFQMLTSVRADPRQLQPAVQCGIKDCPSKLEQSASSYPIHPITIDSCFQAAQISATCGNLDAFRCHVPVFISECRVQSRSMVSENGGPGVVRAQSQRTGFATLRADCLLVDSNGVPLVEMKGVQLRKYMGRVKKTETATPQSMVRCPALRICWKPDIMRLQLDNVMHIDAQIEKVINQGRLSTSDDELTATIGFLLDLAGHKNPRMSVLELGAENEQSRQMWLEILGNGTAFPRFQSWDSVGLDELDGLLDKNLAADAHRVLVYSGNESQGLWADPVDKLSALLRNSGTVIMRNSDSAQKALTLWGFSTVTVRDQVVLGVRDPGRSSLNGKPVVVLTCEASESLQPFITELMESFKALVADDIRIVSLDQMIAGNISPDTICISTLEVEKPFIATMGEERLNMLQTLTDKVKNIVWLTGANMLAVPNPDLALVSGLSRALMVEQPALRFVVFDIGPQSSTPCGDLRNVCEAVIGVLKTYEGDDNEFIYHDGLLHVSRFEPLQHWNATLQRRTQNRDVWEKIPLLAAAPARLSIGTVGLTDTMHFQRVCEPTTAPPSGFIDVQVKAVSLNAKDVYTMSGHVETRTGTAAIEFGGIVTAVGPGITNVAQGDRVVVVTPNTFSTTERVPSWTAHKLLPGEEFSVMASLPTVYCAALYAIRDRARLESEESVLVHSGAGAFGIAAIAIAQRTGATVYTTAGSEERRMYLIEKIGIPASHVFSSRDDSFFDSFKLATKNRGVDVIINSLTGDLMHASWRCLAPFGRFVEVGKRELVDNGRLEMNVFARNTTFTAFDLTEMYFQEDDRYKGVVTRLIEDVFKLYRSKEIQAVPIKSFDVAEISQAYRFFSSKERIGKVVVSLEKGDSLVQVAPSKYLTLLNRNKVYLLVGALGGLGRSLVRWMVSRGAQKFVFLQRSGCDKPGAQEFINQLERGGVRSTVVKGDVAVFNDVVASVSACNDFGVPLGGVLQAAMALSERLFVQMTSQDWWASVNPKWAGTWNLHRAIQGHDEKLDFFLMTSSMNGSVGIPTETNYCAANAFLDAFAMWRRTQGKPAISLGLGMISEIGYIHENPDIQTLLLRRGIQPLDEKTVLQLVDLAMAGTESTTDNLSSTSVRSHQNQPAHILTGMETAGILRLHEQGFEVSHSVMGDPRASIIAAELEAKLRVKQTGQSGDADAEGPVTNIIWLKGLPEGAIRTLRAERTASTLKEAILGALRRRFSHLMLTPVEQIDPSQPFAQFGIDSMIAAEFRSWLWSSLKVEVPFLDLLSPRKSLDTLAALLEEGLIKEKMSKKRMEINGEHKVRGNEKE
ncbi:polyketide synthase-like protein [Xylaria scruposa]|nr:polyketide synthase-like protein [Xylaria scruposa]